MTDSPNPFDPDRLAHAQPLRVARLAARPALGAVVTILAIVSLKLSAGLPAAGLSWLALVVAAAGYMGVGTVGLRLLGREWTGSTVSGAAGGAVAGLILWGMHAWPQLLPVGTVVRSVAVGGLTLGFVCHLLRGHDA
jgi:hypothetical protein